MNASVSLEAIVSFLDETFQTRQIEDFPNACNGLQLGNSGSVTRIAGAADVIQRIVYDHQIFDRRIGLQR